MDKLNLEKCIIERKSTYDIAKKFKKSQSTIRYWLKKFNLKTNLDLTKKHRLRRENKNEITKLGYVGTGKIQCIR